MVSKRQHLELTTFKKTIPKDKFGTHHFWEHVPPKTTLNPWLPLKLSKKANSAAHLCWTKVGAWECGSVAIKHPAPNRPEQASHQPAASQTAGQLAASQAAANWAALANKQNGAGPNSQPGATRDLYTIENQLGGQINWVIQHDLKSGTRIVNRIGSYKSWIVKY